MTDWKDVYVVDTKIPARAKNAMVAEFGDAVTLGDVADMPLGELRRLKGVGAAAVQRVVDVVAAFSWPWPIGGRAIRRIWRVECNPTASLNV